MIHSAKSQMKKSIKQHSRIHAKISSSIRSKINFYFGAYCKICLLILCLNSPALASEDVKPASENIQSASKDIQSTSENMPSASEGAESSENIKPTNEAIKSTSEATKPASENIDLNFESSMKGMAMLFQSFSFHIASSTNFGLPHAGIDTQTSANVGFSTGLNYLAPLLQLDAPYVDFGVRFRYLYSNTFARTHSVGAVFYIHPFQNYKIPFLSKKRESQGYVSLALGGGGLFLSANVPSLGQNYRYTFSGSYIEAGVRLLGLSPISVDILYRASFYGEGARELGIDSMAHGVYVVLDISSGIFALSHWFK